MRNDENERHFITLLKVFKCTDITNSLIREYPFYDKRKWRFDFADLTNKIAIEIDGGQWCAGGGRHNRDSDREKLNMAAALGWRVFRFSGSQLKKEPEKCIDALKLAYMVYFKDPYQKGTTNEHK